jgi:hypothetical protein
MPLIFARVEVPSGRYRLDVHAGYLLAGGVALWLLS